MKRNELKVGEAYYYTRSNNYTEWGDGKKAVVVDDKRYSEPSYRSGRGPNYVESPKGLLVLVDIHDMFADKEAVRRQAVPPAHLRGPWDEVREAVDKARAEARARAFAAQARKDEEAAVAKAAIERARSLGIVARRAYGRGTTVEVEAAVLEKLLDAYAARVAQEG